MTITLGNGNQAKFLTPGTHEFVYGKTWEVPDGCFALAFHLMDPIAATSQRWTDVDRFVNAPLEYVIMFEGTLYNRFGMSRNRVQGPPLYSYTMFRTKIIPD